MYYRAAKGKCLALGSAISMCLHWFNRDHVQRATLTYSKPQEQSEEARMAAFICGCLRTHPTSVHEREAWVCWVTTS